MNELEALIEAIVNHYASDPSTPSVTLSCVNGRWYASIIRYREPYGEGKQVLAKCTDDTLLGAIQGVANIHATAMRLLDAVGN